MHADIDWRTVCIFLKTVIIAAMFSLSTVSALLLPALLGGSLLLAGCSDDTASGKPQKARAPHLVELAPAQIRAVRTELAASSRLQTRRIARLGTEIGGRIVQLPVYPGDRVKQGELLLALDDGLIRIELDKARAQRQQAQSEYDRLLKLKPKQLASDEEITRARTALQIAKAEVRLQQNRLQRSRLLAPFDGVITQRLLETDEVVAAKTHVLTLLDPNSLFLTLSLAEQWLPWLAVGDHVILRIAALGNSWHDGEIRRIHPVIEQSSRQGKIEVELTPLPFGATAGQLVSAKLFTQSVDRLVIPAHSLQYDSRGAYVYTVDDDNIAHRVNVTAGQQYGEWIAIDEGLSVNDRIVIKGSIGLREGKRVKPVSHTS